MRHAGEAVILRISYVGTKNSFFLDHNIDIPSRDVATAEAALLALSPLVRILKNRDARVNDISSTLRPLVGISWSAAAIRRVGCRQINAIILPLTYSRLGSTDYSRIVCHWETSISRGDSFPPRRGSWWALSERWDTDTKFELPDFTPVLHWMTTRERPAPFDLSRTPCAAISTALVSLHFSSQSWASGKRPF